VRLMPEPDATESEPTADPDRSSGLPDPVTEPTLTVQRTADILNISRGSAYKAIESGDIPSFRIGSRILIPTAPVLRMLMVDDSEAA
jgi:excisionase family DNA binding protein